jgi:glutamate/tyrosine decarboxylase-like PLP-dependent enzyme
MKSLPATGQSEADVLGALQQFRANDLTWRDGKTFGYVFDPGADVERVAKTAFNEFMSENGLDPTAFPSLMRFENELVSIGASHLGGDEHVVGNFTSGGTESCLLAVKTARDAMRARKGITEPELILPVTAHAAFHKGAEYFGLKKVLVPVDPVTFKADVDAVRAAITPNTVMIVSSAPSYAHGVIDPIEALGQIALEHDVLLHVDGCIGGWLLPYFRRLGAPVPAFDFSVPGVTSMSMDLHKYAYTPKGASLVLYKDADLRKYQIFSCPGWTGYTIVNPTIQSTKSGGPVAAAWAVVHYVGDAGYLDLSRRVKDARDAFVAGINAIDGLRVLGDPEMSLIAVASDDPAVNIFDVIDETNLRGWYIQPQLKLDGYPENFHISLQNSGSEHMDALLADIADAVAAAREIESTGLVERLMGMLSTVDLNSLDDAALANLLTLAGISPGGPLPERMSEINQILNALPTEVNGRVLKAWFNVLNTYRD